MDQLWDDVQQYLADRLGPQAVEVWIRHIEPIEASDGKVELRVPNRYYLEWVQSNYQHEMEKAFGVALGRPQSLHFVCDETRKASPPSKAPPAQLHDASSAIHGFPRDKTFENFVVGSCNQFANAAALAVTENPGTTYNPLYIYGETGVGKTHLVQAIGNRIIENRSEARVAYTTGEVFVNEMIKAIRFKQMDAFHALYREQADVLIIDDIQILSGKERSQEEFFHTFESLQRAKRQIVITSDVLPRKIAGLAPRLRSRFEGGLQADIQPPDLETMIAILRQKTDERGLRPEPEVIEWLATHCSLNVREVEGALNNIVAKARFHDEPLTLAFVERELGGLYQKDKPRLGVRDVIDAVARVYNVRPSDVTGPRRMRNLVKPRHLAMYLARKHTSLSFPELGRIFGGRDHSTVQYACRKLQAGIRTDADLRNNIETIEHNLGL